MATQLLPESIRPATIYFPSELFSASELNAWVAAGVLRQMVGDTYIHTNASETPKLRAEALFSYGERHLFGDWIATQRSAAWVFLGGTPPRIFECNTEQYQRVPPQMCYSPFAIRQGQYHSLDWIDTRGYRDIQRMGSLTLTTLEQTVEDLVRVGKTPEHLKDATRLLPHVQTDDVFKRMRNRRAHPGMIEALQRLRKITAP